MNNCNIDESRLILYLYGELTADEQSLFEKHLETCPECRSAIKDYQDVIQKLEHLPYLVPTRSIPLTALTGSSRREQPPFIPPLLRGVKGVVGYGAIAAIILLSVITYLKISPTKPATKSTIQEQTSSPSYESGSGIPEQIPEESEELYSWD
ncbi:MAG: zf-HC2 domain-containing protein, partial [Planctomycetota bacterium]|nr:zf-HC2 domain-containing protein [Planctomycetota bacterium]